MKKRTVVILAIILLVILATPYMAGYVLEKDFMAFNEAIERQSNNNFKIKSKYFRGIFSSSAQTEITFTNSYTVVQLEHYIQHGPVIFDFNGWMSPSTYIPRGYKLGVITTRFTGNIQKEIENIYGNKEEGYSIQSDISLHGSIATSISINPLKFDRTDAAGPGTLNWQGMQVVINSDMDIKQLTAEVKTPLIEYSESIGQGMTQTLSISKVSMNFNHDEIKNDVKLMIENIKLQNNDQEEFSLQNYSLTVDHVAQNNLVDLDLQKKFTKLVLGADSYGPLDFSLHLKNWNEKAIDAAMSDVPMSPVAMTAQNDKILLALLTNKISLTSDFKFVTPDGDMLTDLKAEIGGPNITAITSEQILPTLMANQHWQINRKIVYKMLFKFAENQIKSNEKKFYAQNQTSNIVNPYTMTDDQRKNTINTWINELIAMLIAQNFVVLNGDNFVLDLSFDKNILTINGSQKTESDFEALLPNFVVVKPVATQDGAQGSMTDQTNQSTPASIPDQNNSQTNSNTTTTN